MQEVVQKIRKNLRLSMNGIASSLMREKGVDYKLNFGVSIPRLRQMAKQYAPNKALAETLWKEQTRELKILATLIYPPEEFALASVWIEDIDNQELAEQASMNLFCKMPDALFYASGWTKQDAIYPLICGFSVYNRLMMNGLTMNRQEADVFIQSAITAFHHESLGVKQGVINALDRFFTQSPEQSEYLQSKLTAEKELLEFMI